VARPGTPTVSARTATRNFMAGNLSAGALLRSVRAYEAAGLDVAVPTRCQALGITDTGLVLLFAQAGLDADEIDVLHRGRRLPTRSTLRTLAALRGHLVSARKPKRTPLPSSLGHPSGRSGGCN
jgi:hypothetical protein